jgi:hypothetical protein
MNDSSDGGIGGAEEIRTPDPLNAIQVLFQLSYSPTLGKDRPSPGRSQYSNR